MTVPHPVVEKIMPSEEDKISAVAIPEGWRGPACQMFDQEMAKRLGDPTYCRAASIASMLAHYDEISFEPSRQEQALLQSRRQEILEAQKWVHDNVLLNPLIKRLMYETVRDLGRETGDAEVDDPRRAFLAEMESSGVGTLD